MNSPAENRRRIARDQQATKKKGYKSDQWSRILTNSNDINYAEKVGMGNLGTRDPKEDTGEHMTRRKDL